MAPIAVSIERREPPVAIVSLIGESDAYSAVRAESELELLLDSGLRIVIDLSETTFADSHTLGVLLSARHRAEQAGIGFVLALPTDSYTQVDRLLDLTGLRAVFAIFPNLDDALAASRAGENVGPCAHAA
jgi:anti-sigma B factor antagonist